MTPAYIALGSNLDNPAQQLRNALHTLEHLPYSQVARASSVYRSSAVGPGDQPDYLNAVVLLQTQLEPEDLLHALQDIENAQGRVREERWGPRTLDLDLLLYGDLEIHTQTLTVPHPRMGERDFVLYPLREISNTSVLLPGGPDIDALLQQCPGNGLEKTRIKLRGQGLS